MPHATLRLVPTVNTTETPALNENGGISKSNLIRFQPDSAANSALCQKLGGWTRFVASTMQAIVRALWAWEDLNQSAHLALGTQMIPMTTRSQLAVITAGTLVDITPIQANSAITPPPAFTTIGSASVKINDAVTTGITNSCSVYIPTHIAVGGIVLFGLYACDPDGFSNPSQYTVFARDILGNLTPATNGNAAALPQFTTAATSNVVTVALPNHGYSVGLTFPILVSTVVGGLTLYGNYIVRTVQDANTFTFTAENAATGTATVPLNNGIAIFIYNGADAQPPSSLPIKTDDWTMDNFGEDLISCPTTSLAAALGIPYQPILFWDPTGQTTASVIPQAPPVNDGVFVAMPQRQLVAWGSTRTGIQDPLLVTWCDINNVAQWIPLPTNQAGSYRIPKGSRIVGAAQGPQQALIWTDIDVWSMQYVGPPYVYGFNEVGTGCGLIGRKAAAFVNGIPYWMGVNQFYTYGGNGVQVVPCPVWDFVFQNLLRTPAALSKIRVAVNSLFEEIQWFFPSAAGTGEVDSYVKYNFHFGLWDHGSLGRSAWVDQSVLGPPIGADPASLYLYQHETSNDADGAAMLPFFQTGYYTLAEGDFQTFVDWVWPDMKWGFFNAAPTAQVQISFITADYPGDTPKIFGPYTVTQATQFFNTRLRARLIAIRISSADLGSFWRIGAIRYRFAPDGKI